VSQEEKALEKALFDEGYIFQAQVKIELNDKDAQEARAPHYRVDFLIGKRLVVEVDSYTHRMRRKTWDVRKDSILRRNGFRVLHLTNKTVRASISNCLGLINRQLAPDELDRSAMEGRKSKRRLRGGIIGYTHQ